MMFYLHRSVLLGQVSHGFPQCGVDNGTCHGTASESSQKFQVNYQTFTESLLFPQSLTLTGSMFNVCFLITGIKNESLRTLLS